MSTEYDDYVEYEERLKELFFNIHNDTIMNLHFTNTKYRKLVDNAHEEDRKIKKILDTLSEEDKKFFENNEEDARVIDMIEREAIYFQGFRDCIKHLSFLKLI